VVGLCYRATVQGNTALPAVSAAGLFGVAVFALSGSRRSGFAFTLALLTADLAGFGLAQAIESADHIDAWRALDVTLSPLAPPLGLMLVLRFTGRLRKDQRSARLAASYFGLLSVLGLASFVHEGARGWLTTSAWPIAYMVGLLPSLGLACLRLLAYGRQVSAPGERGRAWGILLGLLGAIPLGMTDLLADLGFDVPRLSAIAGPVVAFVLAGLAVGADLFGAHRRRAALLVALTGAALVLGPYALLRYFLPGPLVLPSLLVLVASLYGLLFAGSYAFARLLARGQRERQAYAGRMAQQLAHDLNTPLTALRGAVDFLMEERRRRGAPEHDDEAEMFALLDAQVDRLAHVDASYRRLLRLECEPEPTALTALLERVLATVRAAFPDHRFTLDAPARLEATIDSALLLAALENVLKNAAEASAPDREIVLRARAIGPRVRVEVNDRGVGMDPRELSLALQGGGSDKPGGQGLGLPFARRICRLHGGELWVESQPELGTRVALLLPSKEAS